MRGELAKRYAVFAKGYALLAKRYAESLAKRYATRRTFPQAFVEKLTGRKDIYLPPSDSKNDKGNLQLRMNCQLAIGNTSGVFQTRDAPLGKSRIHIAFGPVIFRIAALFHLFLSFAGSCKATAKELGILEVMMNYNTENKNAYKGDWAMEETTTQKVERVGLVGISDKELLSLALGEKTLFSDDIASSILKVLDGSQMNPEELFRELATIRGLEISKALAIVSMIEFSRRRNLKNGKSITTPADIYSEIKHFYSDEQEKMIVVALNGAHEILSTKVVTLGLINRTVVHPREVFADALKQRAVAIAIAHNHPSRNLEPSEEDKSVTDRIVKAGEILGIKVLDHLVFSDYGYYSFLEHGLMY